jgi:hypothetical protein
MVQKLSEYWQAYQFSLHKFLFQHFPYAFYFLDFIAINLVLYLLIKHLPYFKRYNSRPRDNTMMKYIEFWPSGDLGFNSLQEAQTKQRPALDILCDSPCPSSCPGLVLLAQQRQICKGKSQVTVRGRDCKNYDLFPFYIQRNRISYEILSR